MFTVLDVSRWQGRIDWDTVKASGRVHGVMLRALGSRSGMPSWPSCTMPSEESGFSCLLPSTWRMPVCVP